MSSNVSREGEQYERMKEKLHKAIAKAEQNLVGTKHDQAPPSHAIQEQELVGHMDVPLTTQHEVYNHRDVQHPPIKQPSKHHTERLAQKYFKAITIACGSLFLLTGVLLYFGSTGSVDVGEVYGYHHDPGHLRRNTGVLFFVMSFINLVPFILPRFRTYESFPIVIACLNIFLACHFVLESCLHASSSIVWGLFGLIVFSVLNYFLVYFTNLNKESVGA